jgi:hypothetical protein
MFLHMRYLRCMKVVPAMTVATLLASSYGFAQTPTTDVEARAPVMQSKPPAREIGDVTSSLLRMQADGSAAGAALPMLGATSAISWGRYKDSFAYPIPEYFGKVVKKSEGQ